MLEGTYTESSGKLQMSEIDPSFSPSSLSKSTNSLESRGPEDRPLRGRGSRGGRVPGPAGLKKKGRPRGSKNKRKHEDQPDPDRRLVTHVGTQGDMLFPRDSQNMQAANDPPPNTQLVTPPRTSLALSPPAHTPMQLNLTPPSLNLSQLPSPDTGLFPPSPSLTALLDSADAALILQSVPEENLSGGQPSASFMDDWPLLEPGQHGSIGAARPDSVKYATLKGVNLRAQLAMLVQR